METAASLADLDTEETKKASHASLGFHPRQAKSSQRPSTKTASLMNVQTIVEL